MRVTSCFRGDADCLAALLAEAHQRMDGRLDEYPLRAQLDRTAVLTHREWSVLDGRHSCIDGRPL